MKKQFPITDSIVIRPLNKNDLEQLFDERERELGVQWLTRQESGEMYVAVAEIDGVPVGRRCLDFKHSSQERVGYAFAASVLPDWRSRGIGSMFDPHFEQVARAKGLLGIRCIVSKNNERSRSWHKKMGYSCIGESITHWTEPDREVEVDCWKFERAFGLYSWFLLRLPQWRKRYESLRIVSMKRYYFRKIRKTLFNGS